MPATEKAPAALLLTETSLAGALDDPALAARVTVQSNPRARRVSLRVDPFNGCVVLVRPPRVSDKAVATFVKSRQGWIAKHIAALPARIAFADGAIIPFRGQEHVLCFRAEARGSVWREDGAGEPAIVVAGRPEHLARRLRDWLKAEARSALTPPVYAMAKALDVKISRVSVRDTRSRWGSCSRDGKLSFSWRLILAPASVLTYVAAHEVAHLKHMNHGPGFWRTVARLLDDCPADISGANLDWVSAREWLRRSGAALHRYG
ncbi:MAG: M48 family peptidase [Rhodospirillaceae bacterium]|nr:M48 family peptidase [Rhodospirillaceae bacterium]